MKIYFEVIFSVIEEDPISYPSGLTGPVGSSGDVAINSNSCIQFLLKNCRIGLIRLIHINQILFIRDISCFLATHRRVYLAGSHSSIANYQWRLALIEY